MPGVYGDHAKPGGWNDIYLDEYFERKTREKEARGDFGAAEMLERATAMVEIAYHTGHLRRAQALFQNAGLLAAKEARFAKYDINGWDGEPIQLPLPPFERVEDGEARWFVDWPVRSLEDVPEEFKLVAGLVTNSLVEVEEV